ncbi:MAG: OmpH family outer membrane protein [Hyphomonadaceae bacterium]
MRPIHALAAAFALACAAMSPAYAQSGQSGAVIVVDGERILSQSQAGRDMTQRLQAVAAQIQGELTPEQTALTTEQQRLANATRNQTQEQIRANSQLTTQIEAFNRRAETFRNRQVQSARDLEHTRNLAIQEFNRQITPILNEVMTSRGAVAILDTTVASRFLPSADATADVISRLDQRVRTINVTRTAAPAPPQPPAQQNR